MWLKVVDEKNYVKGTPERKTLWLVQTPQVFEKDLVWKAYSRLIEQEKRGDLTLQVTDDAMVVESMMEHPVKLVMGSYENMKLTTPEDLDIGKVFVRRIYKEI